MDSEARIQRMLEAGTLSASQAGMLRESLAMGLSGTADPTPRTGWRRSALWLVAAAALLFVLVLIFAGSGADVGQMEIQNVAATLNQPEGHLQMNRFFSVALAATVFIAAPLLVWIWLHNALVSKEERVFQAWAQTESNMQRRADLIPRLVETVSRYLSHEKDTLVGVTEKRSDAVASMSKAVEELARSGKASADLLRRRETKVIEDEEALRQLYLAQLAVGRSMNGILAIAEQYPELRSSDQFLELQAQLEGTENRINVARMRFNEAVGDFNGAIRQLPTALVAQVGKFRRKAYFESQEEARHVQALQFN